MKCCWLLLSIVCSRAYSADFRLAQAAHDHNDAVAKALIKEGVNVNAALPDGSTALAWAAYWGDLDLAQGLIRAGANVNASNENGVNPLWLACSNGSTRMVTGLLDAGADPNSNRLPGGETALHRCAATGQADAVQSLLAHGAEIDARERAGQTALMWAIEERHPDVARVLIEQGANVNAISEGGFTPMRFAARQGDIDSARILIQKGAALDTQFKSAEAKGSAAPAKGLLWFGRPEPMDALMLAIHSGREQFAVFLLQHGANPNLVDIHGMTPLHYALQEGISELDGSSHDPRYAALDFLFRPNMADLIGVLLDHGGDPNARILKRVNPLTISERPKISLTGATPFLLAAATGDVDVMKRLLSYGADPLLPTEDGTTPLMAAAGIGRSEDRSKEEAKNALEALKLIVELGGDVNAVNGNGLTAMHGAASTGANDIIQFLAAHGAKLDMRDKFGETPLSIAAGDPNGLAEDAYRRVHSDTEALLRRLTGDHSSLVDAATPARDR